MRKYENILDEDFAKEVKLIKNLNAVKNKNLAGGLNLSYIKLDENNPFRRPMGEFFTINCTNRVEENYTRLVKNLSKVIKSLLVDAHKIMLVGMGNEYILSDTLGVETVRKIDVFNTGKNFELFKFCPGVEGVTGMESYDVIKALIKAFGVDTLIVVDSLCTKNKDRLGLSFQVTNSGIVPGSAMGKDICNLSKNTLGVNVLAIGVPMVVDLMSTISEAVKKIKPLTQQELKALKDSFDGEIYSPKDIDLYISNASNVISSALIKALKN